MPWSNRSSTSSLCPALTALKRLVKGTSSTCLKPLEYRKSNRASVTYPFSDAWKNPRTNLGMEIAHPGLESIYRHQRFSDSFNNVFPRCSSPHTSQKSGHSNNGTKDRCIPVIRVDRPELAMHVFVRHGRCSAHLSFPGKKKFMEDERVREGG